MTAVALTSDNLTHLKRALRPIFPQAKSSHLTEALATAVGRRTHVALLEDLKRSDPTDPEIALLDKAAFLARLKVLGYEQPIGEGFELFESLASQERPAYLIRTGTHDSLHIRYDTPRKLAWRNMMVAAINAGIEQKLFSIRPGDNRWPNANAERDRTFVFDFVIGNGIPALGSVVDGGYDELAIHVAFWPTDVGRRFVAAANAGFVAGEAFAAGWLERRRGAWLEVPSRPDLWCRRHRLSEIVDLVVKPKGFGDRGPFIL